MYSCQPVYYSTPRLNFQHLTTVFYKQFLYAQEKKAKNPPRTGRGGQLILFLRLRGFGRFISARVFGAFFKFGVFHMPLENIFVEEYISHAQKHH